MPNRCLVVISGSLIALGAGPSLALVIDDFEAGSIPLVVDSGLNDLIPPVVVIPATVGAQAEQTGLSTANVVGGVRLVAAVATNPTDLSDLPVDPADLNLPLPIAVAEHRAADRDRARGHGGAPTIGVLTQR